MHISGGSAVDSGLHFTADGQLQLIEAGTGTVVWDAGVSGGHMLIIQNNGNLALYNVQETIIWSTNTDTIYCEKGNNIRY